MQFIHKMNEMICYSYDILFFSQVISDRGIGDKDGLIK